MEPLAFTMMLSAGVGKKLTYMCISVFLLQNVSGPCVEHLFIEIYRNVIMMLLKQKPKKELKNLKLG